MYQFTIVYQGASVGILSVVSVFPRRIGLKHSQGWSVPLASRFQFTAPNLLSASKPLPEGGGCPTIRRGGTVTDGPGGKGDYRLWRVFGRELLLYFEY